MAKQIQISKVNKRVGFFINIRRNLQQCTTSLGEIWRTPFTSLITIAVLGVCISLPTTFYLSVKNSKLIIDHWQNKAQITAFMILGSNQEEQEALIRKLKKYREVSDVKFISAEQGLVDFKKSSGFDDALKYIDDNPLPAVAIVIPNSRFTSPDRVKMLLEKIKKEELVDTAKIDIEWLQRFDTFIRIISSAGGLLITLLLMAVILIIANTLRLNILNRRGEIEVMKLVGATNNFIQKPFLYTGFWYGFIGGVLSWVISNIMLFGIETAITEIGRIIGRPIVLIGLSFYEILMLLIFTIFISLISSLFTVKKYIKDIEPV